MAAGHRIAGISKASIDALSRRREKPALLNEKSGVLDHRRISYSCPTIAWGWADACGAAVLGALSHRRHPHDRGLPTTCTRSVIHSRPPATAGRTVSEVSVPDGAGRGHYRTGPDLSRPGGSGLEPGHVDCSGPRRAQGPVRHSRHAAVARRGRKEKGERRARAGPALSAWRRGRREQALGPPARPGDQRGEQGRGRAGSPVQPDPALSLACRDALRSPDPVGDPHQWQALAALLPGSEITLGRVSGDRSLATARRARPL